MYRGVARTAAFWTRGSGWRPGWRPSRPSVWLVPYPARLHGSAGQPLTGGSVWLRVSDDPWRSSLAPPRGLASGSKDAKPSSKIEVTVQRLKQKQLDQLSELSSVQDLEKKVESLIAQAEKDEKASQSLAKPKKSIWVRIVDEVKHYYSGFKLLFLDVRVSSRIIWKVLQGHPLTRREKKQLVRTVSDLFRLVPFSVFILVPFMELLLPVALKLFPGMLPSTFTSRSDRDVKMRRRLKAKLEYARFLQETLDEMAPTSRNDRSSESARDFVEFYQKVKNQGLVIENKDIIKFSKLFEDEITLDNMTRTQLVALCRLLELTPMGTNNFLRLQLEMKLRQLRTDDKVIQREGVDDLDVQELQSACRERGMRAYGISEKKLRHQLEQWLDLSLNNNVPPSLLLLSRTLYLPEDLDSTTKIAASISALPESAATVTSATIGEREGKVRNVEKLKIIQEEQRKIEEEAAEDRLVKEENKKKKEDQEARKEKEKEKAAEAQKEKRDEAQAERTPEDPHHDVSELENRFKEQVTEAKEAILHSAAQTLVRTPLPQAAMEEPSVQRLVRNAQISLRRAAKKGDVTQELVDKAEKIGVGQDSESLDDRKDEISAEDLNNLEQEKAAQRDHLSVEEATNQMEKDIKGKGQNRKANEGQDDSLVTIQELIDAVKKLQATTDSSKVEKIATVLSKMDEDSDGLIKVDHVLKVIELLGTEQIQLNSKQIKKILDMLEKEDMMQIEANIEEVLGRTLPDEVATTGEEQGGAAAEPPAKSKSSDTHTVSRGVEENRDIAKDLTEQESEPHIQEMFERPATRQSDSKGVPPRTNSGKK
eukprot:maker-scaffold357_size197762-snap-gene-0.42 protein:Tk03727 transcript:maker-scaffold357_size197762-snap-gene-0.42-mRNA-1 annotation:"paramyosin "